MLDNVQRDAFGPLFKTYCIETYVISLFNDALTRTWIFCKINYKINHFFTRINIDSISINIRNIDFINY